MATQILSTMFSLLFLTTLTSLAAAAKPSPGCGNTPKIVTSSTPTTAPLTLTINNQRREYFVNLPANYNASIPHRLILTLHALGGDATQVISGTGGYLPFYGLPSAIANSTNTSSTPDQTPTIYLAPNGLSRGWSNTNSSDVTFLRTLLTTIQSDLCIDTSLVFSTGFSFGAAMSYMLACTLGPYYLRAVAILSGNPDISGRCPALPTNPTAEKDGVAVYFQHGVNDNVLPITGGRAMRDRFLKVNGCDVAGTTVAVEPGVGSGKARARTEYKGCAEGKPVTWVAFDGPHTPTQRDPGEEVTFSPGETWRFFGQFKGL